MTAPRAVLAIHLGAEHVGDLVLLENDITEFALLPQYRDRPRRPVLGQAFEDNPRAVHRARMRLPPFFSNLLPEGKLRELVASRLDVAPEREFFLLARLGEDLPGNVRALAMGTLPAEPRGSERLVVEETNEGLKFSLAGVQPKLSMLREGRGMTLPVDGRGGDWIVKLPGRELRGVPENEFATMNWAGLVGIEIPQTDLIPAANLRGLPAGFETSQGLAYAVRRFDRPEPTRRVHIEDFAQVRNQYPDYRAKYRSTNYETIARILLAVAGRAAFDAFVRRLVFIVVTANADAHIKNWSLIYPDGVGAELAPAYDLVSTIEFIENDSLALNLARSKAWDQLSLEHFSTFATRVGVAPREVTALVTETVERTLDHWPRVRREYPVSELLAQRLEAHWRRLPLVTARHLRPAR